MASILMSTQKTVEKLPLHCSKVFEEISDLHIVCCLAAVVFQLATVSGTVLTDKHLRIAWTDCSCNYCNETKFVSGPLRSYLQRNG